MKLDERILPGKRPLGCFDTEEAREFIGKEGYFADCMKVFTNVRRYRKCILTAINEEVQRCFQAVSGNYWDYFLPAEWVKETEWRPYLIDDWLQEHDFGDMIEFRSEDKREFTVMFTGFVRETDGTIRIILGDWAENFDNLFEHYELIDKTHDGKIAWRPFGIEVK